MNGTGTFDPKHLKALFSQLVRAIGTQEAAASYLGVSRQYVGYLASANPEHAADVPSWDHVWTLEQALGRSVVFQALADMVSPPKAPANACPLRESMDVARVAVELGPIAMSHINGANGSKGAFEAKLDELLQEVAEARATVAKPLAPVIKMKERG